MGAVFYPLFLAFNRRLLATMRHSKPALTAAESHLLAGINLSPGITASELVPIVRLEKSTVSRTLKDLKKRALVAETPAREDRRRKQLTLTLQGTAELHADGHSRNRDVELALLPLAPREHPILQQYLQQMADTLAQPPVDTRIDDHPIKQQVRRLTRGMGFLGPSCMDTGYPVEECQVLHLVYEANGTLPMAELFRRLPYDRSAISRLVSRLAARGLITKKVPGADRRSRRVGLTKAGNALAQRNLTRGEQFVRSALRGVSPEGLQRFARVLEGFVLEDFEPQSDTVDGITIEEVHSPRGRFAARAFVVEQLVKDRLHLRMPSTLLADDAIVLQAHRHKTPLGVAELTFTPDGATLQQLVCNAPESDERSIIAALFMHILTKLALSPVSITGSAIASRRLLQLFPQLRRRVPLIITSADRAWLETPPR